jgi:MFS family permease
VRNTAYKKYLLTILAIVLAFNYLDRVALGLLLQNIKVDLSLSDTQLGFLSGIAFALFYSVMGIPIARWADRGDRIAIVSLTVAVWSAMVAMCGMATSFVQLLLVRVGVGIGEAGCIPPAHSLIADYFTRGERPRAVSLYMLGGSLSVVIGYFAAGWLNELYGWRSTFIILGLPGLGLSALTWFTLKEPRRRNAARAAEPRLTDLSGGDPATSAAASPSVREVFVTLWANHTFRHLLLCFSVQCFFSFGIGQWLATFFIRSYGLRTGELGTWFALIMGVGGIAGTYLGGELASRFAPSNERLQLKAVAIALWCFALVYACVYLSHNRYLAFGLMGLAMAGGSATMGPLFATIQMLVPQRMRAVSIATVYLFGNLIGLGLGPLAAGALSDSFRPWAGEESLRYALLALCPGFLWGGWHAWRASKTALHDLEVARA